MQFIRYSTKIKTSRRHVIAAAHLVTKVTKLCKVLIASRKVGAGSVHCTLCNRAVKESSPVGTVKLRKGWLAALLFACSVG